MTKTHLIALATSAMLMAPMAANAATITGSWSCETPVDGGTVTGSINYSANGTFSASFDGNFTVEEIALQVSGTASGAYELADGTLTDSTDQVAISILNIAGESQLGTETETEMRNGMLTEDQESTVLTLQSDRLVLQEDGGTTTCTR